MKLLKKLLPIATATSAIVCVAPIATSCSKATMSWVVGQDFETRVQPIYGKYTEQTMLEKYFDDVNKNNIIFVNDIMFNAYIQTETYLEYRITEISCTLDGINVENKTFSFTKSYKSQVGQKVYNNSIVFKNLPFYIYYQSQQSLGFGLKVKTENLKTDDKWSLDFNGEYIRKLFDIEHLDSKNVTDVDIIAFNEIYYRSLYLSNCVLDSGKK